MKRRNNKHEREWKEERKEGMESQMRWMDDGGKSGKKKGGKRGRSYE